jgi:Anti-sigma factor NepR
MNYRGARIPANGMTLVGMGRRPRPRSHFDSVRVGIGNAIRSLHSDVSHESLPDRIAELLRQLDEQLRQLDQDTDKP